MQQSSHDGASAGSPPIRVLLAEDHAVVRQGIAALLARSGGISVVGEVEDGAAAVEAAARLRPDVALLDLALPRMSGIDATREILRVAPSCRVVILSMHRDSEHVAAALAAGARGYVPKAEQGDEVAFAIRSVAAGRLHVSPLATEGYRPGAEPQVPAVGEASLPSVPRGAVDTTSDGPRLSPRETEVLTLVAGGLSTKEVAYRLKISPKTADAHRQAAMKKLAVHDVTGLVRYAVRHGLIDLDAKH